MEPDHIRRRHPLTRVVLTALVLLIVGYLLVTAFYQGGRPVPATVVKTEASPPATQTAPAEQPLPPAEAEQRARSAGE